jgi:hypothetical protein
MSTMDRDMAKTESEREGDRERQKFKETTDLQ